MVTVQRQRSYHKPNGSSQIRQKAKGCFGVPVKIFTDIRPYKGKGRWKTKSMKQIYSEIPRKVVTRSGNQARNLRRKLLTQKLPMPIPRERRIKAGEE